MACLTAAGPVIWVLFDLVTTSNPLYSFTGTRETVETLGGVKVHQDNGWVLVLPDAEQPICRVISESGSAEFAEELTNIYVKKVREISRS